MSDDLVAFLKARLDEDETAAAPGRGALDDLRFELKRGDPYEQHLSSRIEDGLDAQDVTWRARALREVEAKRRIIAEAMELCPEYSGEPNATPAQSGASTVARYGLRIIAAVYSDHPGYRQKWALTSPAL